MLHVIFPDNCHQEHSWISSVLLGDFLGLEYETHFDDVDQVRISAAGKTLELPDVFFAQAKNNWLSGEILPNEPCQNWTVSESGLQPNLVSPAIPVLFGSAGFHLRDSNNATLNLDIFGSCFFMLSRYEEAFSPEHDAHGRFPVTASLAYRKDFLSRPIVDEYVEILWAAMQRLWPMLARKPRQARMLISCDVDSPFDPACNSMYRMSRRIIGQSWRDKSFKGALQKIRNFWAVKKGDYGRDTYRQAITWMMDVNEKAGNQVTFNLIPEKTDKKIDTANNLDEPGMRLLMRSIKNRNHLIGFHPGYNTYKHPEAFAKSVNTLRRVMKEENIHQETLGGRQHYLRWETIKTPQLWDVNGLTYDSSMTYRAMPGFRCGTCQEYSMYDLINRKPFKLRQRPLIIMESAVLDAPYMGLGYGMQSLELMQKYKRICRQFRGDFTLLWHNSCFEKEGAKEIYKEIIQPCRLIQ